MPVDVVYCLGDIVGYNADPEACVEMVLPARGRRWSAAIMTRPLPG